MKIASKRALDDIDAAAEPRVLRRGRKRLFNAADRCTARRSELPRPT